MTKQVKEFLLDHVSGNVDVEYSDNSTSSYNLANAVTANSSGEGLTFEVGSTTRSIVTAEMSAGVPTGNFM